MEQNKEIFKQDFLEQYNRESYIAEINRVAAEIPSGALTREIFRKHSRVSADTIGRCFGSWQDALIAAGISHRYSGKHITDRMRTKPGRSWNREMVTVHLQDIASLIRPKKLTHKLFNIHGKINSAKVSKIFGTWEQALISAGLQPSRHSLSETDAILLLKETAERINSSCLGKSQFSKIHGKCTSIKIIKIFGSWTAAVRKAGLIPKPASRYPIHCKEEFVLVSISAGLNESGLKWLELLRYKSIEYGHAGGFSGTYLKWFSHVYWLSLPLWFMITLTLRRLFTRLPITWRTTIAVVFIAAAILGHRRLIVGY